MALHGDILNSNEAAVPYGEDLLKPLDATKDVGMLACIQTLDSANDDAGGEVGSGANDDWTFTEIGEFAVDTSVITSLN